MRTLVIVILIGVFGLCYFEMTFADIIIDGETVHVETNNYQVQFDRGIITQLHNKLTAETYTLPLSINGTPTGKRGQTGILRTTNGNVYTHESTLIEARKITPLKAELLFHQGGNEITLTIEVEAHTGDLLIGGSGISDIAGVYGFQWGCGGLNIRNLELILPVDGGQVIDASSPITSGRFDYPGLWEAQLAILQGQQGGFFVRETDETFQFKRLDYQKDSESLTLPNNAGYERVFGATQVQTHRSLPHWRAYNETTLLGLDPAKSYLLSNVPRDLSQPHINALPPGVAVTETRVTENAALFRLEKPNISLEVDLLSKLHQARTGIVINGTELPLQRGGTFRHSQSTLSGVTKSAIHAHPFYQDGSGDTFGEFALTLPDSPDIHLEFYMGLWEGSQNSDGVTFIVSVQGDEILHQHYNRQKWQPVTLDLSPYRGELVKLRFTTTPGPNGNASWDWAVWGEPKVISKPDNSLTQVGFFSSVESTASLPDTLRHIGSGHYTLDTLLPAQILFFPRARSASRATL